MATTTQINLEEGFKPTIEGTRITVQQVAEYHRVRGWDAEAIARAFRLAPAQVYAALAYYYDHQAEIDASIESDSEAALSIPSLWNVFSENALAQVMTAQEVAEEYPISVNAVYQAIRRKKLEARQSGKTWLILRRDAEKLWGFRRE